MYQPIYFFEIPIYRVSQEHYGREVEMDKEKSLGYIRDKCMGVGLSMEVVEKSEAYQQAKNNFDREHGMHLWRYNQAIGWLRLFTSDRCHIRADYYWVDAERITKNLKAKHFRYCFDVKTFELDVSSATSSPDIYRVLQQHIEELKGQKPFRNYFLDTEMFQNLGPYIDWRALLDA
jgi:hypothetical protein